MLETQNKVNTTSIGLTLRSANQQEYPVLYTDDAWEVVTNGMALKEVMGAAAAWTQTEINEKIGQAVTENRIKIDEFINKEVEIDTITKEEIDALNWEHK